MSNQQKLSEQIWEKSSEWVDQIGVVIGDLAKQLGVATEHVYTVYTKQVFYEGVVYASVSAAILFALILVNIITWFVTRKYEGEAKWGTRIIAGIIMLIAGSVLTYEGLVPNLLKAFNPEYYTIKTIVEQIGSMMSR